MDQKAAEAFWHICAPDLMPVRLVAPPATESVKSGENGSSIEISKGFRSYRRGPGGEKASVVLL